MLFLCYPKCSTCQKAKKWLEEQKIEYTDKPRAEFRIADGEELVVVYEYCNLHGLWKNQQ